MIPETKKEIHSLEAVNQRIEKWETQKNYFVKKNKELHMKSCIAMKGFWEAYRKKHYGN